MGVLRAILISSLAADESGQKIALGVMAHTRFACCPLGKKWGEKSEGGGSGGERGGRQFFISVLSFSSVVFFVYVLT